MKDSSKQSDMESLSRSLDERKAYFSPSWFRKLLGAGLSLGDTFWIGNFGVLLFVIPLAVVGPMLMIIFGASELALNGVRALLWGLDALYLLALTRAVFVRARMVPEVGGWRWAGVALTLINCLTVAGVALHYWRAL